MRTINTLIIAVGISLIMPITANASNDHAAKQISKTLSADDIKDLQEGAGWGFAKTAELNGVPGPTHLLELKSEIGLTPEQVIKVQSILDKMKSRAIILGKRLIAQELEMEARFQNNIPNAKELKSMVDAIGNTRSQLRFIHLSTHLKTLDIITSNQVLSYNKLRGYGSNNSCTNIPKTQDVEMWKKHNGCK